MSFVNQYSGELYIMHRNYHRKIVWMHFANFIIGLFLILNSFTFHFANTPEGINGIVCGLIVSVFSLVSVNPDRLWAPWIVGFTGLWLNVSTLVFWAEEPIVYNTETFTGILIITFSIVAPGIPGRKLFEKSGSDFPEGWSVNPSSWEQRIPIIFIGWIGFFTSRYLASYQLGYIDQAYDPFFDKGTENVLNSDISKAWPVSDAGLGAFSYMLDAMMGYLGGVNRWRTMPWVVILFGILIIPLGVISIGLIILQPLAVGSWCSVCLFTAIVMLIMIPCTFDEVFASIGVLIEEKKKGKSTWKTLLTGAGSEIKTDEKMEGYDASVKSILRDIFVGLAFPWNLIVTVLIGIWLMFSPSVLGYGNALADSDHLVGALVVTFSVIAMGEIVRITRFINIPIGLWIITAPFILGYQDTLALINAISCGALIVLLSIRRGPVQNNYGKFNKWIW